MSQPLDDSTSQPGQDDTESLDLKHYLHVIVAWWKEILSLAIIVGALAGGAVILQNRTASPTYKAVADIVVARLVSDVTLDDRVSTQAAEVDTTASVTARRGALAQLARSGAIAQAVSDELRDGLPESKQNPSTLLKLVEVEVPRAEDGKTPSDLIRISVTADNPELATRIANTWAAKYIEQANAVFGDLPVDVIESVQAELVLADESYQEAELAYEAFLTTSQIDSLTRQITEKTLQRDNLQIGRDTILNTIADEDRSARIKLFSDLTSTRTQALYRVLNEQSQAQLKGLSQLYADLDRTNRFLDLARGLNEQIRLGGEEAAITNHQALQTLKNQVYSLPDSVRDQDDATALAPNITFITGTDNPSSAADQTKDVEALISALEQQADALQTRINEASEALLSRENYQYLDRMDAGAIFSSTVPTQNIALADDATFNAVSEPSELDGDVEAAILRSYLDLFEVSDLVQLSQNDAAFSKNSSLDQTIREIESTLQMLRSELAADMSAEQKLLQKRDLTWNAYDALSSRVVELKLQRSTTGSEVRLGSSAILPAKSIKQTDPIVAALLAGVFGLLAGIVLALVSDYMGYAPPLSRSAS